MMKTALKYSFLIIALSLVHQDFAQVVNKREKQVSYHVGKNTTLEVENKYGNINITNWDKDSVLIKMKMVVTAKNKDKLSKTLNDIHFDFEKRTDVISIETKVNTSTFSQISEGLFKSNDNVKINYYIKAPSHLALKLNNKFGNIYLEKTKSKIDIKLSHGDFKAKTIENRLKLNLSFGDADITTIKSSHMELNYVDLKVNKASFLNITSKSSDITIDKAGKIVLDARRGDIELNNLGTLSGKSTFSDIEVGELTQELNMEMQYGNLLVERSGVSFSLINLQTRFTDIDLSFKDETSFNFDMSHRKVDFIYSKNKASLETKSIDNSTKKEVYNTYGNFGYSKSSKSRVRINAENSDIKITFQ